jgi:hypothetical protein
VTDTTHQPIAGSKVWNSLEICKLSASVATPVLVFLLGYLLWNGQQRLLQHWERDQFEQRRSAEADVKERERIREFRLAIYSQVGPILNEIVSYHFYVGRWKERS